MIEFDLFCGAVRQAGGVVRVADTNEHSFYVDIAGRELFFPGLFEVTSPLNSRLGARSTKDKGHFLNFCRSEGIPNAGGAYVFLKRVYEGVRPSGHNFNDALNSVDYPCFIKTAKCSRYSAICFDENDVFYALSEAAKHDFVAVVEPYILGEEYKVICVGGDVAAVLRMDGEYIVGDGQLTYEDAVAGELASARLGIDRKKIKDEHVRQIYGNDVLRKRDIIPNGIREHKAHHGKVSRSFCLSENEDVSGLAQQAALSAWEKLRIHLCTIDIIVSWRGALVMEINDTPYLAGVAAKYESVYKNLWRMVFTDVAGELQ